MTNGKMLTYRYPRTMADARLIAAAPELLEALRRLEKRGYLSQHNCAGIDGNNDLAFARAAIAKAEKHETTLTESAARHPCVGDECVAIHGPYTGSHEPDRIVLRFCYAAIAALLLMVWKGWV